MLLALLPEILIFATAITVLVAGVFVESRLKKDAALISFSIFYAIAVVLGIAAYAGFKFYELSWIADQTLFFFDQILVDSFSYFLKCSTLVLFIPVLVALRSYLVAERIYAYEYLVLMFISVLGMFLMFSAQDFLMLYVAIELQALAAYVLAASRTDSRFSAEAGIKYFIIGVLASILLLAGIAFLYIYTGTTQFHNINLFLTLQFGSFPLAVVLALVMIWLGLMIKLGAAPLHFWALDTYQGAPLPVTGFFALLPKFALVGFFSRLYYQVLAGFWSPYEVIVGGRNNYFNRDIDGISIYVWETMKHLFVINIGPITHGPSMPGYSATLRSYGELQDYVLLLPHLTGISTLFLVLGACSLVVGTVGALSQTNLKRLFAYSSLTNVGFLLLTFVPATINAYHGTFFYLLAYSFTTVNFFMVLVVFHVIHHKPVHSILDLHRMAPWLAMVTTLTLLGLAGIPPTIGFATKFYVYFLLVADSYYLTALLVVATSLVAIFFYLRLIVATYSGGFRSLYLSSITTSLPLDFTVVFIVYFFFTNVILVVFAPEYFNLCVDFVESISSFLEAENEDFYLPFVYTSNQ